MGREIKALYESSQQINGVDYFDNGVLGLDPNMTINGTTELPAIRYSPKTADLTDWNAWDYGETLTLQAGTVPTINNGSPYSGYWDDSVLFNSGGYYTIVDPFADITTEDVVLECIFKFGFGANYMPIFGTINGTGEGWMLYTNAAGNIQVFLAESGVSALNNSFGVAGVVDTWYHALVFINRDEASANGANMYLNNVLASSANVSNVQATLATGKFAIGGDNNGNPSYRYNSNVAYAAMWKSAAWHQAGAAGPAEWATIARDRYIALISTS